MSLSVTPQANRAGNTARIWTRGEARLMTFSHLSFATLTWLCTGFVRGGVCQRRIFRVAAGRSPLPVASLRIMSSAAFGCPCQVGSVLHVLSEYADAYSLLSCTGDLITASRLGSRGSLVGVHSVDLSVVESGTRRELRRISQYFIIVIHFTPSYVVYSWSADWVNFGAG